MRPLLGLLVFAPAVVAGCGLDEQGSGANDVDARSPAPPDAGAPEAAADSPPIVDAPPDAPVDSGFGYACPGGASAPDCSSCAGKPINCVYCKSGTPPIGLCTPTGQTCLQSAPSGYSDCPCTAGDPSMCPLVESVCVLGLCSTCGAGDSDFRSCRGGGTCTAATRTCR